MSIGVSSWPDLRNVGYGNSMPRDVCELAPSPAELFGEATREILKEMPGVNRIRFCFPLLLSACAFVLSLCPALAADVSFSGGLERVGSRSLSIRLPDRRVIDAILPDLPDLDTAAVAARYRMGDRVELSCRPIAPVYEEGTARMQTLEVTAIHLVRRPSPEELANLLAGVPFHEGKNLLERPPAAPPLPSQGPTLGDPGGRELANARKVNLEYAANMPNFVADEKAKRYRIGPGSNTWRDFDTVESEITFRGNHAARQSIRRNSKPWNQPFEAMPGFKWYEGFGTEITPLFDAKCPGTIELTGRSHANGRPVIDYRFSAPVDGCFPFFFFDYQRYNPARTGQFSVDEATGSIVRLDEDASGFPAEIQFSDREEHIAWDLIKIAGESHCLPVSARFLVRYYDGTRYRIEVEYKNHRHFEASTNLTFH